MRVGNRKTLVTVSLQVYYKHFQTEEKLKELFGIYTCTQNLDATINSFLYLLYHMPTNLTFLYLSYQPILVVNAFQSKLQISIHFCLSKSACISDFFFF